MSAGQGSRGGVGWAWSAVGLAVLVCISLIVFHGIESAALSKASLSLETMREAQLTLVQGYLHASLGGGPDSPYERERGIALLSQALDVFKEAYGHLPNLPDKEQAIEEFMQGLERLKQGLESAQGSAKNPETETALRLQLFELEGLADELDRAARAEFKMLSARLSTVFTLAGTLAAALLVVVCLTVLRFLRSAETSRAALALELERSESLASGLMTRDKIIERDLEEKVVLLKEVHHRVKNNLQVVSSLLALEAARLRNSVATEAFGRSQERVYAMSLVHELLHESSELRSIDFGDYARRLVLRLGDARGDHDIELGLEPLALSVDQALPLGLMLHEAADNAFKYGRSGTNGAFVRVSVSVEGARGRLEIADQGPGLAPGLDPTSSPSLGFALLRSLASQVEGTVEWISPSAGGLVVRVEFPLVS